MNFFVYQVLAGILVIVGSFLIVRRSETRQGKIIVSTLGFILLGIIALFPLIDEFLDSNNRSLPESNLRYKSDHVMAG